MPYTSKHGPDVTNSGFYNSMMFRRLRLGFAAIFGTLLVIVIVSAVNLRRMAEAERVYTHSFQVLAENNRLKTDIAAIESGARGSATIGDQGYVRQFRSGQKDFNIHIANLHNLTEDNPEQQNRIQRLRSKKLEWERSTLEPLGRLANSLNGKRTLEDVNQAFTLALGAKGLVAEMWGILDDIDGEEQRLLAIRTQNQRSSQQRAMWTLCLSAVVVAGLTLSLFTMLARNARSLEVTNVQLQGEMNERLHAEGAIRESQRALTTLLSNLPGMAYRCRITENYPLDFVSEGAFDLCGYSPEELTAYKALPWLEMIQGDDRRRFIEEIQRALRESRPFQSTYRIIAKNGDVKWVWGQGRGVDDESGNVVAIEGFASDITQLKQTEQQLKSSEARLQALIENTVDSIWSIDADYRLTLFNRVFSDTMLQVSGTYAYVGLPVSEFFHSERYSQWKNYYDRALAGESFRVDQMMERDSVLKEFELSFNPIVTDGLITGVSVFSRDITERKKVDRMKTEFISTVSHELRTPLTSIRGSLGLLAGGVTGPLPDAAKSLVDIAVNNSDRLVRLINDILDVEKIEANKMDFKLQPLSLSTLVANTVESNRAYGTGLSVAFEIDDRLPEGAQVNADADRLNQVLTNLLSNAAKFSPSHETVTIALAKIQGKLRVSITDKGPGISEDFQERVFSKFAQADSSDTRQKGGTGLGLNISRAIIEKMGGTIAFVTGANGTTFYFELPEWVPLPNTQLAEPTRPRVLVCEDDQDIASLLRMMLEQLGFQCDIAHDTLRARELLLSGEYLAMTLDLNLPDNDGISFIRSLRADPLTHKLPIIVVSATAEKGRTELNGDAIGIVDWLEKPIDTDRLRAAVQQASVAQTGAKPHVLHVEDDPDIVEVVSVILRDTADLHRAWSLNEARIKLEEHEYDLVILDIGLPDGSGLNLLPLLNKQPKPVPVVIFSAHEVSGEDARATAATLVKSRTSNQTMLETIQSLLVRTPSKPSLTSESAPGAKARLHAIESEAEAD
jgi:PAS domain S-box-containing protein